MTTAKKCGLGRLSLFLFFCLAGAPLPLVAELSREDLSPNAQRLLPKEDLVEVKLKNGEVIIGSVESETKDLLVLKERTRTITRHHELKSENIASKQRIDVAGYFAKGLARFKLHPKKSISTEQYDRAIDLFKEFLKTCPDHVYAATAKQRLAAFNQEKLNLERGLKKIEGTWLAPIQAAVRTFDMYTRSLGEMEKKYSGINQRNYNANRKAKQYYDRLIIERRDVARSLPRLMNERLPQLLEDGYFDEAIAEMDKFQYFWLSKVIESERGERRGRNNRDTDILKDMDLSYIPRKQNLIMDAYNAAGKGAEPGPEFPEDETMIYIPGGYFLMGSEGASREAASTRQIRGPGMGPAGYGAEAFPMAVSQGTSTGEDTFPYHFVYVAPFMMDKYEVTNAEYKEFVDHVKHTGDSSMEHPDAPPLKNHDAEGWSSSGLKGPDQPVVGVDWYDAYAYATWKNKRLPTEAERERAARSGDGRKFPWGATSLSKTRSNTPSSRTALAAEITRQETPKDKKRKSDTPPPQVRLPSVTWPVKSTVPKRAELTDLSLWTTEDKSPYGVMHMAGNAAEWVADWYQSNYYLTSPLRNPDGPELGEGHVIRGGSYLSPATNSKTYSRHWASDRNRSQGLNEAGQSTTGIRCARSLDIVAQH